jgi:hypothetical protein
MTARETAALAARLLGVYFLTSALVSIPLVWSQMARPGPGLFDRSFDPADVGFYGMFAATAGAGLALLFGARLMAVWLAPKPSNGGALVVDERFGPLALSLAGIVILADAVPGLVTYLYFLVQTLRGREVYGLDRLVGGLLEHGLSVAGGVWLTLGSTGLAHLVRRFRDGGWTAR